MFSSYTVQESLQNEDFPTSIPDASPDYADELRLLRHSIQLRLQQTAINPIFSFLQADPAKLPYLNMAGPITGLLVQPLIGAMSDRTWIPGLGRRRPYFLLGAIGCSLCLFFYPHVTALWVAVLLLWLLDISNNTAMEPFRAFIADTVPERQQSIGFLMQSVFTGLGITLANISLYAFKKIDWLNQTSEAGIPYWVFGSFYIGAVCSIGSVLVTVLSTPEHEPSPEELAAIKAQSGGPVEAVKEIYHAIKDMPKPLWQLASVYLFHGTHSSSTGNTSPTVSPNLYGMLPLPTKSHMRTQWHGPVWSMVFTTS